MKPKYVVKDNRLFVSENGTTKEIPAQVLYNYWKNPTMGNTPREYRKGEDRSNKLISLFDKFCSKEDNILELGCNIGRNLHYLYESGYKNLYGIDINQKALDVGKALYPNTVAKLPLICSTIEDYIIFMLENEIDVMFTMGVLMHIHPSSIWIFNQMRHITKKYLITVEQEDELCEHVFPRDYKFIFEHLGMKQVFEEYIEFPNEVDDKGVLKLTYRVFKK
jgi:SAM-dependent methyltransferase